MMCRRVGCQRLAMRVEGYCDLHRPLLRLKGARTPQQQAVVNVTKKRGWGTAFDDTSVARSNKRPALSRARSDGELDNAPVRVHLPILFLPFEGNYNQRFISGLARGVSEVTLFEQGGATSVPSGPSPFSSQSLDVRDTLRNHLWFKGNASKSVGGVLPRGSTKAQRLGVWTSGYPDIYHAAVKNAFDRLHISGHTSFRAGLPKIIVLSEEVLDWPKSLTVHDQVYNLCSQVNTKSNLQRMAFYVHSHVPKREFGFRIESRPVMYKGSHVETWGIVTHTTLVGSSQRSSVSIACVHLTSKFTDISSSSDTERQLHSVFSFARDREVDAVIGDLNLNTYGQLGGTIPLSQAFEYDGSNKLGLQSTFTASSGSGEKAYIGGLDITGAIGVESTLTTSGESLIPPAAELGNEQVLFSDHHGIYKNFVLQ